MGAGQSAVTGSHPPTRALHVLRVTPSSPASQANIEAFFDFVVGFEGDSSVSRKAVDAAELERIVERHEGKSLNLLVWSSKTQDTRVVPIVPSREWSILSPTPVHAGEPDSDRQPSLLGLSMRMCEPIFSINNVWHVLDVLEGSPAESAGLVPYGDWIIGWSGGVLSAEGDFYEVVETHIDKPLRVYVYSYDFDTIREVVLVPNRQWGGEGLLGCVFGFGLLHRIPALPSDRQPGALPPELVENPNEYEDQDLFVPADTSSEKFDFEFVHTHNQHDLRQHDYAPPVDSDYSYTYDNRGASYSTRTQEAFIPEEPEDHEVNGLAYHDDVHRGHRHVHDSNHSHHSDDDDYENGSHHSNNSYVDHTTSTPRPNFGNSSRSRGFFPNGLRANFRGHSTLSDASSRLDGSRTNSQIAAYDHLTMDAESDVEEKGNVAELTEAKGSNDAASDYGSLTSVE